MIRLSLTPTALLRTSFAFSPLAEVTSSLRILTSGQVPKWHEPWFREVRDKFGKLDWRLLSAVAPNRHILPEFMFQPPSGTATAIEDQLDNLQKLGRDDIEAGLRETWAEQLPDGARRLLEARKATAARLTSALWDYWCLAISPYWADILATLQGDLIRRERLLAEIGLEGLFATLHDDLHFADDRIYINKPEDSHWSLNRAGATIIPSVFVAPHLAIPSSDDRDGIYFIYGAHRFDAVWSSWSRSADTGDSPLDALIGSTKASILEELELPATTLALAERLKLKSPGVSQHLSAMKNSGLLKSRRSGKSVFYYRTELAERLLTVASLPPTAAGSFHHHRIVDRLLDAQKRP